PVPIPSYLIAIASGNLVYRAFPRLVKEKNGPDGAPVKWRTGVWSEPELIESSEWEFVEDTNKYVAAAEDLITPYEFGVYDLLVLPPSFPYGGMENCCLTFVTPTLLAGDRSLVDVVGHEVSHSWFGNNVTTADSGHFWLNEGWTTWLERLLAHKLQGPAARDFSYIIGRKGLDEDLRRYGERIETRRFQRMVIDYEFGEDPDEAYSQVPYEKGGNFLLYLERLLGGLDVFLPYAQDYVRTFRGKSIRTAEWKAHLYEYFQKHHGEEKIKLLDSVDWNAWFYGEGLSMPVEPLYDTTLAKEAYALAKKWKDSENVPIGDVQAMFKKEDLDGFLPMQKVVFLERLSDIGGPSLPLSHLELLSNLYSLHTTPNIELRHRFYMLVLAAKPSAPDGGAARWVYDAGQWVADPKMIKGRMKFCRPIFRSMGKVGDGEYAKRVWRENQVYFHPIARRLIDKDLGLA
ncbi:zincin, partial [Clavulina sp. PMI_390]